MERCFSSYTCSVLEFEDHARPIFNIKYLCVPLDFGSGNFPSSVSLSVIEPKEIWVRQLPAPWYVFLQATQKAKPHTEHIAALLDCSRMTAEPQSRRGQYTTSKRKRTTNNKQPAAQQSPTQGIDEVSGLEGCGVHTRHTFQSILKQKTIITSKQVFSHQGPHLSKNKCRQSACYYIHL